MSYIVTHFITFTDKNRRKKISRSKVWVLESVVGPSQWGGPDLTTTVTSQNFSWMGLFVSISPDPSQGFLMATSPLLSTPNSKSPHLRLHPLIATPQISFQFQNPISTSNPTITPLISTSPNSYKKKLGFGLPQCYSH